MKARICIIAILTLLCVDASAQAKRTKRKADVEAKAVDPQKAKEEALFAEMLPNTQKLLVVDSVVVDIDALTKALPLPEACGRLAAYDDFFKDGKQERGCVSVNGFGNKCFYSEMSADSVWRIYTREKLGEEWSEPQQIRGLGGDFGKIAYPVMMSDGTTMFFSATSKDGLGGYDIYMTSYDYAEGHFLRAENVGLPFNSGADDLLYMEDDVDGVAWLATTRRQPKGKVCVYTIALSATRQNYDEDGLGDKDLRGRAAIESIEDTWPSAEQRETSLGMINAALQSHKSGNVAESQSFVVDDATVCHSVDDFSTAETKQLYKTVMCKEQQRETLTAELEKMRNDYNSATLAKRKQMSEKIIKAEQEIDSLDCDLYDNRNELRQKEQAARKR